MDRIPATEKLYLDDSYTVSFQAKLLSCTRLDAGRVAAVLDRTYFYPESGGQLADCGTIEDAEVIGVWEDESGVVYHGLARELASGTVRCQANWDHRFDHMQQHTGQHVLSRAFIEVGDLHTISFHMGDDACTIDLEGGELSDRIVEEAEALANAVVWQDREVTIKTVAAADLKETSLRKKLPEGVEQVRLVEIEDFDVIGCCGTHVVRTGELGLIKVLKHEKAKGAHRVSFKVGRRAFRDFSDKHEIVKQLANRFTTSVDGLDEKIEKLHSEGQCYRKEFQKLSKRLATLEAEALLQTAEEHNDQRYIVKVLSGYNSSYIKALASELKSKERTISMIGSDDGTIICNASEDADIDFTQPVVEQAKSLGGSGGGKGGFATVRLPKGVAVMDFLERAADVIKHG
jgi:alanyl-tRNA synthetase